MLAFESCGRLPTPDDNVAIATRRIEASTEVVVGERRFRLPHTVLEGHRFVFEPIEEGAALRSWGLPFGEALRDLAAGDYVCNQKMLAALPERGIDFELPAAPSFADRFQRHVLDPAQITPGEQVAPVAEPGTFRGFRRSGRRGVGTRNFVVALGLTSHDAALAVAIAERTRSGLVVPDDAECEVVAVTHTEGGGVERPHNLAFVLRALSGWLVHPNVSGVVVVDHGVGSYGTAELQRHLGAEGYAVQDADVTWLDASGSFEAARDRGVSLLRQAADRALAQRRTEEPLSELKLALQCGGSDAFSGISGNALAGYVAKRLIQNGGAANLAETDELIGAEPYVLQNVASREVAERFVQKIATFEQRAARHGASAEGNPSGGNLFRGLYNITLKSLGAARKKDPEVRLDGVLDYGQPIPQGGYWFMDSPGNDLESIAGQVATGCNLILFITGNGSITNFPFVPTLKFVTTTQRFESLQGEMDVNAGRYNDGMSMPELGDETFELVRRVASGERTKGERAGHAQVSLWREWRQPEGGDAAAAAAAMPVGSLPGEPIPAQPADALSLSFDAFDNAAGVAADRVGLVMPTSLCSGEVASLIAREGSDAARAFGLDRLVALVHTEGCGSANADHLYLETLLGHLRHPNVHAAVLLEHGCEKIHNDAVRTWLKDRGEDVGRFGYASVQMDGGIEKARARVLDWFEQRLGRAPLPPRRPVDAGHVRLGLFTRGPLPPGIAAGLSGLVAGLLAAGARVVLAEGDALLEDPGFAAAVPHDAAQLHATLAYGQFAERAGLHVMAAPTRDPSEVLTGLGGSGVFVIVAASGDRPVQAHPMIPLLQVGVAGGAVDLDCAVAASDGGPAVRGQLAAMLADVLSGRLQPVASRAGNTRFQLTRGDLGISL